MLPRRWLFTVVVALGVLMVLVREVGGSLAAMMRPDHRALQENVSLLLDNLLNPSRYDKRIRPGFGGPPALITVNMFIKSMGPVSETDEEYVMDCYFRQTWYDLRLKYDFPGMDTFSLPWLFLDGVWKPDTYFMNGKKSHLHRITVPNKFLRLSHDGYMVYSTRLTVKASCPMHLRKFPLDSQKCPLLIGSYGYLADDVMYRWQEVDAVKEDGVELAQYDLVNITTRQGRTVMRGKEEFSMIKVSFLMKRHTGYFMLQVFAPCCLIVCCSWVSFWIDPDAVPARVTLGVTTVLSMTTMGFGGRAQMPRVSYATALDWFVILCFSFVFAVMLEYAVINFIDKITSDIRLILEKKGIKKIVKPEPPVVDGPTDTAVTSPASAVVPLLVVDLAPATAESAPDPIYAEVFDATPAAPVAGHGRPAGRTPVLRSLREMQEGEEVLLASMVLSPKEQSECEGDEESDRDELVDDVERHPLPQPPSKRHRRLLRRKSFSDLPAALVAGDVERGRGPGAGAGQRRRASAAPAANRRRSSTFLGVPALGEDADEDVDSDFEDGPHLDRLETIEVTIRGSMMELREALGAATAETSRSLCQLLRKRFSELRSLRLLPTESSVTQLIMADEAPPKFSRIDIASRRYFPLFFFLLFALYWILYLYYITDEIPVKVARVLNKQQHLLRRTTPPVTGPSLGHGLAAPLPRKH